MRQRDLSEATPAAPAAVAAAPAAAVPAAAAARAALPPPRKPAHDVRSGSGKRRKKEWKLAGEMRPEQHGSNAAAVLFGGLFCLALVMGTLVVVVLPLLEETESVRRVRVVVVGGAAGMLASWPARNGTAATAVVAADRVVPAVPRRLVGAPPAGGAPAAWAAWASAAPHDTPAEAAAALAAAGLVSRVTWLRPAWRRAEPRHPAAGVPFVPAVSAAGDGRPCAAGLGGAAWAGEGAACDAAAAASAASSAAPRVVFEETDGGDAVAGHGDVLVLSTGALTGADEAERAAVDAALPDGGAAPLWAALAAGREAAAAGGASCAPDGDALARAVRRAMLGEAPRDGERPSVCGGGGGDARFGAALEAVADAARAAPAAWHLAAAAFERHCARPGGPRPLDLGAAGRWNPDGDAAAALVAGVAASDPDTVLVVRPDGLPSPAAARAEWRLVWLVANAARRAGLVVSLEAAPMTPHAPRPADCGHPRAAPYCWPLDK